MWAKIVALSVFSVAVVGGLVWWQMALQPPGSQEGSLEKVVVGNIGEYSVLNLIAAERGYFQENGLDVEIREFDSGPPAIEALLAGEIDVSIAAEFVGVSHLFRDDTLRILAEVSKHRVFQIVARTDKGILQKTDLRGKKIGVTKNGAGEFFLGRFLTLNHLSLSDVEIVYASATELVQGIESGQFDAIVIFEPHVYSLMNGLGDQIVVWSVQGDQDTFAVVYSTMGYIETNPLRVEKYLRSLAQAERYLVENDTATRSLIARILQYDDAYVDYIWPKFNFGLSLDQSFLLTIEDQARWAIANGLTDAKYVPNYLPYIYFEALEKVRPDVVTIFHEQTSYVH